MTKLRTDLTREIRATIQSRIFVLPFVIQKFKDLKQTELLFVGFFHMDVKLGLLY
jgi:hypothetical protein